MGGWSVMVMILCVYKWSQILVSVCVQVRLNVYKWSLCTSDPFLCVQVIPSQLKEQPTWANKQSQNPVLWCTEVPEFETPLFMQLRQQFVHFAYQRKCRRGGHTDGAVEAFSK